MYKSLTIEIMQIQKAYVQLLKLPLASKERHLMQGTMALMVNMIADFHEVDEEYVQNTFEHYVDLNGYFT